MPAIAELPAKISTQSEARRLGIGGKIVQVLVMLVVVLLGMELVFGLAGMGEQEILRIDAASGYVPMEGKRVTWRKEGFARNQLNSFGMNDEELPLAKPANSLRVAVIGDSLVQAMEVPREQNFCKQLQSKLQADGRNVEVLNFGVQAYNLGQMYVRLRDVALKFQPDVVVLPVRVDSALILPPGPGAGFIFARPNFFEQNGKLIEDHAVRKFWLSSPEGKRMKSTAWLRQHSHIWGVVSSTAEKLIVWYSETKRNLENCWLSLVSPQAVLKNQPLPKSIPIKEAISRPSSVTDGCTGFMWPVADALVGEMDKVCKQANCRLVIVRLPGAHGVTNVFETKLLRETARKWNVPLYDATDDFLNASASEKFHYNTHLTPRGHEFLADKLKPFVNSNL